MERLFKSTKRIIFHKQKDILSSALILSAMIVISRIFGLVRYRTLATYFTKEELDLFFAAFRIPDFVFEILITGALSSAFIPIFIKYQKDRDSLHKNISSIINFITVSLFIFIVVMFLGAQIIIPLLTPGFTQAQNEAVIQMSRVLLISQLPLLVFGNILSGMAQAHKIFIVTAIAPVLYNVGIIAGTILLAQRFWIFAPIFGVIAGSGLFLLVQFPIFRVIKFQFHFFEFNKKVLNEFVTLFVPRALSVLANQIDLTIDLTLSTLLGAGSYTIFFFSQHLQLFPVSFVGMAFGQASLPYLSDLYKERKLTEFKKIYVNSLLQLLYISVPLSLFFIFARTPIVRIVFGGRKFDWVGTNLTAVTVSIFALSIPMHTIFYFITRAFYAMHDTKTPFLINSFSVLVNVVLSFWFILFMKLPVWSLALSFSVAISINILLLLIFFYKKIDGYNFYKLIKHSGKIYVTALLSTIAPYITLKLLDPLVINTTRTINVLILLVLVFGIYGLSYLIFSWLFTVEEIYV
ncbi:MAG: murein biosynthesis integral membrane protein MurJ, partial [Candidatus Paceibacterota bacterium]